MHAHEIVVLCGILCAGFACQWLAWRVRVPAILFLLLVGIAVGPVLDWLHPDDLLGELLLPIVSISVAIILFEGSLTLNFAELRGHGAAVRNLATFGVLITWIASSLAAHFILHWDLLLAALFGAIVTVSGPTVVMPLLRTVRPTPAVASVLRWEAILIDPLGAILGLIVFDFIIATQASQGLAQASITVLTIVAAGTLLGGVGGYLLGLAVRTRRIPDFLRDYATLASVLGIFAAAESIHGESGLLAVTVMGVWLANMRDVDLDDVVEFKESITLILVAGLFILLAARLDLQALGSLGLAALTMVLVLQFVAGPLRAAVCTIGSALSWRERLFLGWVFPRGIVAAAISALFALRLEQQGYAQADSLVPVVFSVIIGTVIIQSFTARPMARWLGVAAPDPTGVLIIGSNAVAIAIAEALHQNGRAVILADSHWASVKRARMLGIPTFFGSAVSNYADRNLDLSELGTLFSLSRQPGLNELACLRFANEFGRDNVFTINSHAQGEHDKHKVSGERGGRILFDGELSLDVLQKQFKSGYELKSTVLTEEFDYEKYREQNVACQPLFSIDKSGRIHMSLADQPFEPKTGWIVTALTPPPSKPPAPAKVRDQPG